MMRPEVVLPGGPPGGRFLAAVRTGEHLREVMGISSSYPARFGNVKTLPGELNSSEGKKGHFMAKGHNLILRGCLKNLEDFQVTTPLAAARPQARPPPRVNGHPPFATAEVRGNRRLS